MHRSHESGEDYLETILLLKRRKGSVRSVDIANELGYSRPSVSRAVGILKKDGSILMADNGEIELTQKGQALAEAVYEKHTSLTEFLMKTAGVDAETAETDACRIEHIISPQTFDGIKTYLRSQH
ncbi:MAG: metal-dependent transcriptional regulator [Lachnospiraceae bacterium]|nr:metal-dependent transcriptional regulator [Lachnospiraceae bacterium]